MGLFFIDADVNPMLKLGVAIQMCLILIVIFGALTTPLRDDKTQSFAGFMVFMMIMMHVAIPSFIMVGAGSIYENYIKSPKDITPH